MGYFKPKSEISNDLSITIQVLHYLMINLKQPIYSDLTKISKILYLCDWKFTITYNEKLLDIDWKHSNFGLITNNFNFSLAIELLSSKLNQESKLPNHFKSILDFVLEKVERLKYTDFVTLVYSTYPMITTSPSDEVLDLKKFAIEYKEYKNNKLQKE